MKKFITFLTLITIPWNIAKQVTKTTANLNPYPSFLPSKPIVKSINNLNKILNNNNTINNKMGVLIIIISMKKTILRIINTTFKLLIGIHIQQRIFPLIYLATISTVRQWLIFKREVDPLLVKYGLSQQNPNTTLDLKVHSSLNPW